ncbi:hypothetical protein [Streptomyces sp. LN590]|uniref:hypothetical protein n=1 Tax=Streptomyces sp. LN590 TaxID=3112980 RepID=UPI0037197F12
MVCEQEDARMNLLEMSEREYFANVAKRPGMFIGLTTLAGLEGYLDGYHAHSLRHGGPGLDWREWLVYRGKRDCNHGWSGLVRHIALPEGWGAKLTPDQEERTIKVLFELLDEFLAERDAVKEQTAWGDQAQ